jgi:hypothetical protein
MSELHAPPREKDSWDKASIVGQLLVPVMLAAFTAAYSCQEAAQRHAEARENVALQKDNAKTERVNAVAAILPYVRGNADSAQVTLVASALGSLGYEDFALDLATRSRSIPALESLATAASSSAIRDSAFAELVRLSSELPVVVDSGRTQLASVAADSAVARVQATESTAPGDSTAAVTGGYRNVEQARVDADSIRAKGYAAIVYVRNGVARTAIRFNTRNEARQALPQIQAQVRRSAYLVDWNKWCPEPTQQSGHVRCAPSDPENPLN